MVVTRQAVTPASAEPNIAHGYLMFSRMLVRGLPARRHDSTHFPLLSPSSLHATAAYTLFPLQEDHPCDAQKWLVRNKDLYRFFLAEFLATGPPGLREELATAVRKHDEILQMLVEPTGEVNLNLLGRMDVAPKKAEFDAHSDEAISSIMDILASEEAGQDFRAAAIAHDLLCFMQFPNSIPDAALHHGIIAHAPSFMLVRQENAVSSRIAAQLSMLAATGPTDSEERRNLQRSLRIFTHTSISCASVQQAKTKENTQQTQKQ
ncbi:hypothetical protein N7540_011333 [Penicillium herquei]|nr:hypothetical protein N7540_011333 [Penicillium herquei]